MPWMRFTGAEWDQSDPASFRIEIGERQIVISGHNLEPMFAAIEHARLARVRAHPKFADDPAHEVDVFATSIRFIHLGPAAHKRARRPASAPALSHDFSAKRIHNLKQQTKGYL